MGRWGVGQQGALGRHAAKGVGGAVVAFFGLMVLFFGAMAGNEWHKAQGWDEATARVDGVVVRVHEPAWYDKGAGSVDVEYVVGGTAYRFETGRDPGERFFRVNDVVPVEYAVARPGKARAVWAVEAARSGLGSLTFIAGLCGVLATASGVGWLVGRRRVRRR